MSNGCKRIAYIGGENVSTAIERLEGYKGALAAAGLPILSDYILCRSHGDDAGDLTGYAATRELLSLPQPPDGIFCNNDPIAMGAMNAILEGDLRIPEDICIVGAGNVRYAQALRIPLSSMDQDCKLLGQRAAELALSLIQSKTMPRPRQVVLPPRLVARQSSLRIAPGSR